MRLAAATGVLVTSGLVLAGCAGEPEARGPAEVLAQYQEARNARDLDALRAVYAEDAVITGHPLDDDGVADVNEVIALWTERIDAMAGFDDEEVRFFNAEVAGDSVTFTHIFRSGQDYFCGDGDEITVQDGKITRYTWMDSPTQGCNADQLALWGDIS